MPACLLARVRRSVPWPGPHHNAEAQWDRQAASNFVGTEAPDFTATAVFDEEFMKVNLCDYRGNKYVVLFFYPLDFIFVCPTEITAFSDRYADFSAIDPEVYLLDVYAANCNVCCANSAPAT